MHRYLSNYGDYIGCFRNGCLQSETLFSPQSGFINSPDNCTRACQRDEYSYAGLHNISVCLCSRKTPCFKRPSDDKYCGLPCKHDSGKFCGGISYVSIYEVYDNVENYTSGLPASTINTTNGDEQTPTRTPEEKTGLSSLHLGLIAGTSALFVLVLLALISKRVCMSRRRSVARLSVRKDNDSDGKKDDPAGGYPVYNQVLYVTSPPSKSSATASTTDLARTSDDVQHHYNYPDIQKFNTSAYKNKAETPDAALVHSYHSPNADKPSKTDAEGYLVPVIKTSPTNSKGTPDDGHLYNYPDPLEGEEDKSGGNGQDTPTSSKVEYLEIDDESVPKNTGSASENRIGSKRVYETKIRRM